MIDGNSVFAKTETGFAFKPHWKNIYEKTFNNQTFKQDGNESAISKMKNFNPLGLIVHHLAIRERVQKNEVNQVRNGYIIDVLTSVENQVSIKIEGKSSPKLPRSYF